MDKIMCVKPAFNAARTRVVSGRAATFATGDTSVFGAAYLGQDLGAPVRGIDAHKPAFAVTTQGRAAWSSPV